MLPKYPVIMPEPFAENGDKAIIPDTQDSPGRAAYREGFPIETQLPPEAGGIPPYRIDFNGILNSLSQFSFYQQSGGIAVYSNELDYPVPAIVWFNKNLWICIKENGPNTLAGVIEPAEGENWTEFSAAKYDVGEFYYFRHPTLKPGFAPLQGGLISGVYQGKNITEYPIWDYLQTAEGQLLCKTEAEWQAMTTAIWHTNADKTTVGWDGIGGAPYYVQDLGAGTLRMPDVRGMYAEAAGYDALSVGGVHGDMIRNIIGSFTSSNNGVLGLFDKGAGAVNIPPGSNYPAVSVTPGVGGNYVSIDASRVVPTGNKVAPRAWGALPCAYLGRPAS